MNMDENTAEQKLIQLGLTLPPAPTPMGVYKPCLVDGKYLYVSGHGPFREDSSLIIGRVGQDLDMEEAKIAANLTSHLAFWPCAAARGWMGATLAANLAPASIP